MEIPRFPDDFRILYAYGGASYWHWHPDAPPDYDGTWPIGDPPPWAGGLQISTMESVQAELGAEPLIVVWEFGPEFESGPWTQNVHPTIPSVQDAIDRIMKDVR